MNHPKKPKEKDRDFLERIHEFLENHMDDPEIDVSTICQEIGITRSPLHQKLKRLTGHSATAFIRHVRLNQAKTLLQQSSYSITQVALACGFRSPSYFSRSFRKKFGQNPSEYRNETLVNEHANSYSAAAPWRPSRKPEEL